MEEIKNKINKTLCEIDKIQDNLTFVMGELDELKQEQDAENKKYKPKMNAKYYGVDVIDKAVTCLFWDNDRIDRFYLKYKLVFKTEEEAKEYSDFLIEKEKHMNTFTDEEWKDDSIDKYSYAYKCKGDYVGWTTANIIREYKPYFRTQEEVLKFIKEYEWQIKHELGVK